jgi:hypothetical protein
MIIRSKLARLIPSWIPINILPIRIGLDVTTWSKITTLEKLRASTSRQSQDFPAELALRDLDLDN